jgi:hypothetical protein
VISGLHRWLCLACPHQVTARTERAAVEALNAHQHYAHSGELKIVRDHLATLPVTVR